jgi:hypothetical protein
MRSSPQLDYLIAVLSSIPASSYIIYSKWGGRRSNVLKNPAHKKFKEITSRLLGKCNINTNGWVFPTKYLPFLAVLRLRGILVWIRILGCVPLTNRCRFGIGYDSVSDLQDGS